LRSLRNAASPPLPSWRTGRSREEEGSAVTRGHCANRTLGEIFRGNLLPGITLSVFGISPRILVAARRAGQLCSVDHTALVSPGSLRYREGCRAVAATNSGAGDRLYWVLPRAQLLRRLARHHVWQPIAGRSCRRRATGWSTLTDCGQLPAARNASGPDTPGSRRSAISSRGGNDSRRRGSSWTADLHVPLSVMRGGRDGNCTAGDACPLHAHENH
jgi:hypothetical protein